MSNPRPWFSLTKDIGTIAETTAEYVFETDDPKVVELPDSVDKIHRAVRRMQSEIIELEGERDKAVISYNRKIASVRKEMRRFQQAYIEKGHEIGVRGEVPE